MTDRKELNKEPIRLSNEDLEQVTGGKVKATQPDLSKVPDDCPRKGEILYRTCQDCNNYSICYCFSGCLDRWTN